MENKTLTKEQVANIINNTPVGLDKKVVLQKLVERGYQLEGFNPNARPVVQTKQQEFQQAGQETSADLKQIGTDIKGSLAERNAKIEANKARQASGQQGEVRTGLQNVGQVLGFGADAIGDVIKGGVKAVLPAKAEQAVKSGIESAVTPIVQSSPVQGLLQKYETLKTTNPKLAADIDSALGLGEFVGNFVGLEGAKVAGTAVKEGAAVAGEQILKTGAELGVKANEIWNTLLKSGVNDIATLKSTIEDAGSTFFNKISQPDVSEATKVSLNPKEALKDTGQDIMVSVNGKMKPLSKITVSESSKIKSGTIKNIDNFTKQAEKFSKDRSVVGGSPVEIVGSRTDKALSFADKKRQIVGNEMGVIEDKFSGTVVPMRDNTFKSFSDIVDYAKNPKYGVQSQNAPVVQKLIDDFDALNNSGLTVGERNDFVRTWQQYLKDAKDPFGNFKENATANTKIQNAVNNLRNETVEAIPDKTYKKLRKQYATYKKLEEIGNQLLGKDGLLGERIKGAATVKRAIQSNSDAGARQFLIKLRELTGYDAIKEGDLALTAMENVGDYQGLSLLNIVKEGKSGLINKALEKGQDFLVGTKKERVSKYIRK